MPLNKHVYCVAIAFKMTEWEEQRICIKFCFKLEHSSVEIIRMVQKATAVGNSWLTASSQQCATSCITSPAEDFFGKTIVTQVIQHPLQPRFGALWLLAFPKIKITFEREGISDQPSMRFSKIRWGSWWQVQQRILQSVLHSGRGAGRAVWGPKVPTLKGNEVSLSYVQCSSCILQ